MFFEIFAIAYTLSDIPQSYSRVRRLSTQSHPLMSTQENRKESRNKTAHSLYSTPRASLDALYSESSSRSSNPDRSADWSSPRDSAYSISARWQNTY